MTKTLIANPLHATNTLSCHRNSLTEDSRKGTNYLGLRASHVKERVDISKRQYDRMKRQYTATADRSLRSLLYVDCLLPGMGAVQRTKATRSLLIGHAAHMSMSFHEEKGVQNIDTESLDRRSSHVSRPNPPPPPLLPSFLPSRDQ